MMASVTTGKLAIVLGAIGSVDPAMRSDGDQGRKALELSIAFTLPAAGTGLRTV